MFDGSILGYIIVAVVGFVIGVFVYRNNVDLFTPFASKIDARFDELKAEIKQIKNRQ